MKKSAFLVVAGEGLEPTTSGLSLRAALPHLPFAGRRPDLPANGAAAEKARLLHPPPAAQPRFSQRAPLVGPITQGVWNQAISSVIEKAARQKADCFSMVAGEGLEPTTSGL